MRRRRTQQLTIKQPRVFMLGKDGVGKSALVVRFITKRFIGEYARSLEDSYSVHVEMENEDVELQITDTAGENTAEKLSLICRQGDMFFIVYSITDRSSFEEAERIGRFIKDSLHRETVDMVVVANKCDLDHLRRVTSDEGCELATELNCNFYEVSTSEDCKRVREVVKTSLLNFIRHREKLRETGNLKVPSFVKRTPSFEKRKRSGRNSQDNLKTVVTTFEIRQRMRLKEEGDGYDDKANNNNAQGIYGKQSENGGKDLMTPSKAINNESSKNRPFHVEKIKNASQSRDRQKVTSSTDKSPVISNDEKPKIPFTVHKVKGSSASEWMRPLPVDKLRPVPNYWIRTEQTVCEEKPKKGPFSLDRRRNHDQSTEKLNRASSSNERSRSTSSFTRMKDGLIGRTKALRRKPIYL